VTGGDVETIELSNDDKFEQAKKTVIEIYKEHNPSKLSEVDTLLAKYSGREKELINRLVAKYVKPNPSASCFETPSADREAPGGGNSRVYMDFEDIEGKQLGRVQYRLYDHLTPLTAENFRALCTGELVSTM
jgi:hypothetical protein